MLLSATVLFVVLSLVRLPPPAEVLPLLELVVELTRIEPRPEPLEEPAPPPAPQTQPEPVEPAVDPAAAETVPLPAPATPSAATGDGEPVDWEALREEAIKAVLDAAEREQNYSVNPPFERLRAEAAVRFRASLAPGTVNAWDSVEQDQLGRTILRLGDGSCFQVLDDPSAVNRWAFETFESSLVYCEFYFGGKRGKDLPWVELVKERYPYLRDPVPLP